MHKMFVVCLLLIIARVFGCDGAFAGTIVINEVLSNAPGQDSGAGSPGDRFEFVELYNDSSSSVDVEGWLLDDGDSVDEIIAWEGPELPWEGVLTGKTILLPGHYALVMDPEVVDPGPPFPYEVPESTLILTVSNTTLGDGLSTTDPISIFNSAGEVIDTFGTPGEDDGFPYDPGDGISLEKADPGSADLPSSWGPCVSPSGATPGSLNSLTRSTDASMKSGVIVPSQRELNPGDEIRLGCTLINFGRNPLPSLSVYFYAVEGLSPVFDGLLSFEVIELSGGVLPGDSVRLEATWSGGGEGFYSLLAVASTTGDEYAENDSARTSLRVGSPLSPVIINEIYTWRQGEEPQWVELYNSSAVLTGIDGWWVTDEGSTAAILQGKSNFLPGYSYLVLTGSRDEFMVHNPGVPSFRIVEAAPFPVFNKSGDSVVLCDRWGTRVDSMEYGGAPEDGVGVSWERVSSGVHSSIPANWALSLGPAGKTPAARNSVALENVPQNRALDVWPRVITPDGDGVNDRVYISYEVPFLSSTVSLKVFTSSGVQVATVTTGLRAPGEGSFLWDGRGENGAVLPTGLYILLLECHEDETRQMVALKRTVVIANRF